MAREGVRRVTHPVRDHNPTHPMKRTADYMGIQGIQGIQGIPGKAGRSIQIKTGGNQKCWKSRT
ncbi:MAG: hypothetical protein HFH85_18675 [Lachnospiraceae bacterium]|nr:hypothetical protein [Lachnospiraceae bacterium]